MRIGLVDVDGHRFPNLALMKLSAYHKKNGDFVEWANSLEPYDKVYMAKVFTFSRDDVQAYQTEQLIRGGTGYDLSSKLPEEAERQFPDYSLYGITDTAYGFLTRGCPRGCAFCIVGKKEGLRAKRVADLKDFWNGQKKITLLDPNLLACPDWADLLGQLAESKAEVDFTQGLDIRLMTDEKARAINRLKYTSLHFAWDNPDDKTTFKKLKEYRNVFKTSKHNAIVYVLCNFNSSYEQDIYRVEKLRDIGYSPYVMVYNKQTAPRATRDLQRYVNNRKIFYSLPNFASYQRSLRR